MLDASRQDQHEDEVVDAIRSTAVVPPAKLTQAPPVMHTSADHKNCAYYGDSQKLYCVHGDPATGAFYSEDYIRDLRILSQGLVTSLESMFALVKKDFLKSKQ